MKRLAVVLSALTLGVAVLSAPAVVTAWGNTGHRLISIWPATSPPGGC